MMSKIINAKSQIGNTEKCESEMMLEYASSGYKNIINVYIVGNNRCLCQLFRLNDTWGIQNINFRVDDSDHLRQIADKLDALNGVKVPEFLKEQA